MSGAGRAIRFGEIVAACERIEKLVEGLGLAAFAVDEITQDAVRLALVGIGHAAACQPPAARARLPGVDWDRLERLKDAKAIKAMPVDELWRFAIEEAPELGRKLR